MPHGINLRRDSALEEEEEGNLGTGLILRVDMSECSCGNALYGASSYKAPVKWGVRRDGGLGGGTGEITAPFEDQRILPVKC